MSASQKMKSFGMAALATLVGRDVSIIYRWEKALRPGGKGISDRNKTLLIRATSGSAHAIGWDDFRPAIAEAA